MERDGGVVRYSGDGFDVVFDPGDVAATVRGMAGGPVDLTWLHIMDQILTAVTAPRAVNHISAMLEHATAH
jgi:hypothetical protein